MFKWRRFRKRLKKTRESKKLEVNTPIGYSYPIKPYKLESRILLDATAPALIASELINQDTSNPTEVAQSVEALFNSPSQPSDNTGAQESDSGEATDTTMLNTPTATPSANTPQIVSNTNPTLINLEDITGNLINGRFDVLSGPHQGSLSTDPTSGQLIYTPKPDYEGLDSFLIQVEHLDFTMRLYEVNFSVLEMDADLDITTEAMSASDGIEIAFVHESIKDLDTLLQGLRDDVEVYILGRNTSGLDEILNILNGRENITALHLIGEGTDAEMHLGGSFLTLSSMQNEFAAQLTQIGSYLAQDADLLIYGCNFGAGEAGQEAVRLLSDLTGADVAASDNRTGHYTQSGDWSLEVMSGVVESDIAISYQGQEAWYGSLATYTVTRLADDTSAGSLRWAIEQANINLGFDSIVFETYGTITLNITLSISDHLSIDGGYNGNRIIISGGGLIRPFTISSGLNVSLSNMVIEQGVSNLGGGISSQAHLTLDNVHLRNNIVSSTSGWGGAVYSYGAGSLTVINCTFSDNSTTVASGRGGAIYATNVLNINNSLFERNKADVTSGQGGAIYSTSALVINGSTFIGNTANFSTSGQGGAIYATGTTNFYINNNDFIDNRASSNGGAIYSATTNLLTAGQVINSYFEGNIAGTTVSTGGGGAIYFVTGAFDVTGSDFYGNKAGSGGAIFSTGTSSSINNISNTIFRENFNNTGALYWGAGVSGRVLNVNSSLFENNKSYASSGNTVGGIFYASVSGSMLYVKDSTFNRNRGFASAGALFNNSAGNMVVLNSTFAENSTIGGPSGGAINNNTTTGQLAVLSSTFYGNFVYNSNVNVGGAIYAGKMALYGNVFATSTDSVRQANSTVSNFSGNYNVSHSTATNSLGAALVNFSYANNILIDGSSFALHGSSTVAKSYIPIYSASRSNPLVTYNNLGLAYNNDGALTPAIKNYFNTHRVNDQAGRARPSGTSAMSLGAVEADTSILSVLPQSTGSLVELGNGIYNLEGPSASRFQITPDGNLSFILPPSAGVYQVHVIKDGQFVKAYYVVVSDQSLLVETHLDEIDVFSDSAVGLREAILMANLLPGENAITFSSAVANQQIDISVLGRLYSYDMLTLNGEDKSIAISGNNINQILNLSASSDVTISNLSFINGKYIFGGAITSSGLLTLNNAQFNSNNVDSNGYGGAVASSGQLYINNSQFYNNQAINSGARGGAIYSTGQLFIDGSSFYDNKTNLTNGLGGAIFSNSILSISDSTFSNNQAYQGGALYTQYTGSRTISGSTFVNNGVSNSSSTNGGAIYFKDGIFNVNESYFEANKAGYGSAIVGYTLFAGTSNISKSQFMANQQNYGIVYIYTATQNVRVDVVDSAFKNNIMQYYGVIYYSDVSSAGTGQLTVNRTLFSDNSAGYYGTAIMSSASRPIIVTNSTFYRNTSTFGYGSAIYNSSMSANQLVVMSSSFIDNVGSSAIYTGNLTSIGNLFSSPSNGFAINGGPSQTQYNLINSTAIDLDYYYGNQYTEALRPVGDALNTLDYGNIYAVVDSSMSMSQGLKDYLIGTNGGLGVLNLDQNQRPRTAGVNNMSYGAMEVAKPLLNPINQLLVSEDDGIISGTFNANDVIPFTFQLLEFVDGFNLSEDGQWSLNLSGYSYLASGALHDLNISYQVTNSYGATNIGALPIRIEGQNDAPNIITPLSMFGHDNVNLVIDGVFIEDADNDIESIEFRVAHGILNIDVPSNLPMVRLTNGLLLSLGNGANQQDLNLALETLVYKSKVNFNGTDQLEITVTDSNGAVTIRTVNLNITDLTAPDVSSVSVYPVVNGYVTSLSPTLVGKAEPSSRIDIFIGGQNGTRVTVQADANGNWSYMAGNLIGIDYGVTVYATDAHGNVSLAALFNFKVNVGNQAVAQQVSSTSQYQSNNLAVDLEDGGDTSLTFENEPQMENGESELPIFSTQLLTVLPVAELQESLSPENVNAEASETVEQIQSSAQNSIDERNGRNRYIYKLEEGSGNKKVSTHDYKLLDSSGNLTNTITIENVGTVTIKGSRIIFQPQNGATLNSIDVKVRVIDQNNSFEDRTVKIDTGEKSKNNQQKGVSNNKVSDLGPSFTEGELKNSINGDLDTILLTLGLSASEYANLIQTTASNDIISDEEYSQLDIQAKMDAVGKVKG